MERGVIAVFRPGPAEFPAQQVILDETESVAGPLPEGRPE